MASLQKKRELKAPAEQEGENAALKRYNNIFFILFLTFQIAVIVGNGLFTRPQPLLTTSPIDNGLFTTVGAALLLLIGFGLYFTYLRSSVWSGIGFTFFITTIVFQAYFLVNGFWSRVPIQSTTVTWSNTIINAYLSNQNYTSSSTDTYGATAVGAIKCALSVSIAFAAIGGRAGYLQALLVSIVGTILYEINRQLTTLFAIDYGGTMSIFLFGGAMGSTLSLILYIKQSDLIKGHVQYATKKINRTLALIGAAFCWVFFPVINMDISPKLFFYSNAGLSTIICVSSCVVTTVGICLTVDARIHVRNLITAPIAGGVIVGSSSANIYTALEAIMLGMLAAVLQFIFNRVESKAQKPIASHNVITLFGVQGLVGGMVAAAFRAVNKSSGSFGTLYNSLTGKFSQEPKGQLIATAISLGIGLGAGLIAGILVYNVNKQRRSTIFHDKRYWLIDEYGLQQKWEMPSQPSLHLQQVASETGYKGAYSFL